MSKSTPKVEVVQYFMSIWYGFAIGPVDRILRISVDEKTVWSGSVEGSAVISLDKRDIFGGIRKEGGVSGSITYLDGKATQTIPNYLARKLGLTKDTCPAHRGIASLFFSGGTSGTPLSDYGTGTSSTVYPEATTAGGLDGAFASATMSTDRGFYWRANQPQVPPIWIKARRRPRGLNSAYAMIGADANPIHIIYEVMTNNDWGLGAPASSIGSSFAAAAVTIYNEGIGVSLLWTEQTKGEDFIAIILEYVEGVIYVDPASGLLEIKLIRGDYDVDDLFHITPDNAVLSGYQRKMWGETTNELVVTWTNPENEEEETVTVQDLGNIAMQGGIVSDTKDYKGIRSADLAMKLGARDLRVASSPLMSCRATVDRSAWKVVPGDVVKVSWPEHGMEEIVMRVGEVDYGKTNDSKIKLTLLEDVFGLDAGSYYTPPSTAWETESTTPTPLDYSTAFTLPRYLMVQMGVDPESLTDPDVCVAVLGADNSSDVSQYLIVYEEGTPTGETVWKGSELRSPLSRARLVASLPFSGTTSVATISLPTSGYGVVKNQLALLGSDEQTQEFCVVTDVGADTVTLQRGVLDTTPKDWPIDTPIWFIPLDADVIDDTMRIGGLPITYRLLSMTSEGTLAIDDAPDLPVTLTRRPWLPLRPANCKVNGVGSGSVNADGLASLTLTWSNRNRLFEDSVILGWTDGSTAPEVGQTTTITVLAADGVTVIDTIDGLTGTSYTLSTSVIGAASSAFIKFTSKNADGDESLQGHMIRVILGAGYGFDYGNNYGGA